MPPQDTTRPLVPYIGQPTTSPVITPASLQTVTPIDLSGTIPPPIIPTIPDQPPVIADAPIQTEANSLSTQLSDLLGTTAGKATDTLNTANDPTVVASRNEANRLADLYKTRSAAYDSAVTGLENSPTGNGNADIRASMLFGQQGAVLRQKATDLERINADYQVATGQYDKALASAQRIVDLKYAPALEQIDIKTKQLAAIQPLLTTAEKKQATALAYELEKQKTAIADQKQKAKDIQSMILNAQVTQAPASVLENANEMAQRGGSVLDVAKALGKYGGDYQKAELLKEQIKTERAQQSKYYADASKVRAETDALGTPLSVDGVISKLPKATQERYYKLQGDFDTATKNYRGAIDSANSITALSKDATPQQQTAIIFQYMKTLDPSSTVREGEFALVGATAGLGDRAINALKRLDNGSRLNETQINDIVGATNILAENAKKNLDLTSNEYDRRAVKFGLPKGLFYEKQDMTISPEAEAIRAKIKAANPTIGAEKIQGTDIINGINNGVTNFTLPANPNKR